MKGSPVNKFQLVGLTPAGLLDPSIAIAAGRAGGIGILNLDLTSDVAQARRAIARLVKYGGEHVGIRVDCSDLRVVEQLLAQLPEVVKLVILTSSTPDDLTPLISMLHQQQRQVWLEVNEVRQVRQDVDGLIAKGNEAGGWIGEDTTSILLQRLLSQYNLCLLYTSPSPRDS